MCVFSKKKTRGGWLQIFSVLSWIYFNRIFFCVVLLTVVSNHGWDVRKCSQLVSLFTAANWHLAAPESLSNKRFRISFPDASRIALADMVYYLCFFVSIFVFVLTLLILLWYVVLVPVVEVFVVVGWVWRSGRKSKHMQSAAKHRKKKNNKTNENKLYAQNQILKLLLIIDVVSIWLYAQKYKNTIIIIVIEMMMQRNWSRWYAVLSITFGELFWV